jgi:hypothetical protein
MWRKNASSITRFRVVVPAARLAGRAADPALDRRRTGTRRRDFFIDGVLGEIRKPTVELARPMPARTVSDLRVNHWKCSILAFLGCTPELTLL